MQDSDLANSWRCNPCIVLLEVFPGSFSLGTNMVGRVLKPIEYKLSWDRDCTSKILNFLLTVSLGHSMTPSGCVLLLPAVNRRLEKRVPLEVPVLFPGTVTQPGLWGQYPQPVARQIKMYLPRWLFGRVK